MSNDRIERAMGVLPSLVFQQDTLGLRSLLEDMYESAQDDLLSDLCSVETAAARWNVSDRRARAHIARLHDKYGIGLQFGGTWLLRRRDIERNPPDQKYRRSDDAERVE